MSGLMKWDALLGQRVLDAVSFLVPALLFSAFALSPKASDLQNGLIQFGVLSFFLLGSLARLLGGWNQLRSYRFQVGSAVFDITCLFAFLLIIPLAYGSPFAISLKAPTANLLFVFIIARIVLFDIRLVVWSGLSAAIGWGALTAIALFDPGSPGLTRQFVDYTTSGKILIGAQVEQIISILLVTAVSAAVVNAYQRDGLTGLRKKREFLEAFVRRRSRREKRGPTALILIRLENWHELAIANKSAANQTLKNVTATLLDAPIPHEMAARYETDSIILWKRCAEDDVAFLNHLEVLKRRVQDIAGPLRLGVQLGAVRVNSSPETAVKNVELACDRAAYRVNRIQLCDEEFVSWVKQQSRLKQRLETAADDGLLIVYHQPIVDMLSNRMVGTEALLRLRSEDGSFVSPAAFIPIAEQTGLIDEIGAYVLETASNDSLIMRQQGLDDDLFVSVNVAPAQVHAWTRLFAASDKAIRQGTNLKLEITESSAAQNPYMNERLVELRSCGAKLAIDDFGTGYSSLERLADLPFDTVKIDIAFTRKITTDAGFAMIDAIVRMASASGKDVIIEGIENAEQQALAMKAGIRFGQGFFFGRPGRIDEVLTRAGVNPTSVRVKQTA